MDHRGPRVLVLVENLSVPFDRRVWQESRELSDAGYRVEVIYPRGTKQETKPFAEIDGVRIHRYPLTAATRGPYGYLREYARPSGARRLSREEPFRYRPHLQSTGLAVPDRLHVRPTGARFLFDHHNFVRVVRH